MKIHHPVDSSASPKFSGIQTFLRLPHLKTTEEVDFAVIGIPFDTGSTYRTGARFAPTAIRNASGMVRLCNPHYKMNIYDYVSGVDYGDIDVTPGNIEATLDHIDKGVKPIVSAGVIPISLGGDHSISLGELRAVAMQYGPVALVHFDSHVDTDEGPLGLTHNHGTTFRRAIEEKLLDVEHSIQVGIRGSIYHVDEVKASQDLGLKVITADEIKAVPLR